MHPGVRSYIDSVLEGLTALLDAGRVQRVCLSLRDVTEGATGVLEGRGGASTLEGRGGGGPLEAGGVLEQYVFDVHHQPPQTELRSDAPPFGSLH